MKEISAEIYKTAERNKSYGTQAAAALIGYLELFSPVWVILDIPE